MITPSSTNPEGDRDGRLHLPRLLHRPVPGLRDGEVRPREPQAQQGGGAPGQQERLLHRAWRTSSAASSPRWAGRSSPPRATAKGDTDFRAQLTAIKKHAAGGHLRPRLLHRRRASSPARRASWASRCRCWAATAGTREKLFELGGSAIEGSYFSNHYSPDDPIPRVQKFIADYKARYGAVPDALAALGYDAAKVAIDAMKRARRTSTGPAIRDAIAADEGLPGRGRHHHPGREPQRGEARGGAQGRRTARRKYVDHDQPA